MVGSAIKVSTTDNFKRGISSVDVYDIFSMRWRRESSIILSTV